MNDETDKDKKSDEELFRQAMRDVTPLQPANRIRRPPPPRKAPLRQDNDEAPAQAGFPDSTFEDTCPDLLYFERPGIQKAVLKKLRGGRLRVDSSLDLHGSTIDQARQLLIGFFEECRQFDHRHVIIVHGKGFRSEHKPVIKPLVNRWLREADEVLAFCSAQPKDGGTGAVYVLLRRARDA